MEAIAESTTTDLPKAHARADQRIYVQLGRYGDICNILPLAYQDAQRGERSAVMAAKEFADIMDGVGYADCIVFDGSMGELDKAATQAEAVSHNVKVVQLVGPREMIKQIVITRNGAEYKTISESFLKDQWILAGRGADWKLQLPLVFDRRNAERESELIKAHIRPRKKSILIADTGTSSPFEHRQLLREVITLKFGRQFHIVDLTTFKAERIFDLLGLFEHPSTHCLIATDSAPLHLAYACSRLPVVALVNDKPSMWHGSCWRPNHIAHVRYGDFPLRVLDVFSAIQSIGKPGSFLPPTEGRKIIHTWSQYEWDRDGDKAAHKGWSRVYQSGPWVACAVEVGALGRDSATRWKDGKRFPFLKDVIRLATLRANDDDVICLTRSSTELRPALTAEILEKAPCFAHRATQTELGWTYNPAVDLFAFTKKWWRDHQNECPDMVMGRDYYWHRVLKEVIALHGGAELSPVYSQHETRSTTGGSGGSQRVIHNETAALKFLKAHNIKAAVPPVHRQRAFVSLNRKGLSPFGYNPCIIMHKGSMLMAYRWHASGDLSTRLAMAELDEQFNPVVNSRIHIANERNSGEDPRLFTFGGELYCAFVSSTWPVQPPKSVVRYGKLGQRNGQWHIDSWVQLDYGKNNGTAMEKNWLFFEHEGKLYCIYHNHPKQLVLQIDGDKVVAEHESETPHWPWGGLHAGTPPVPYGGRLLRFFHSRLDNERYPVKHRYYVGAALMEATPPFKILTISQKPIFKGSEADEMTELERPACFHHKANVAFPGGCVVTRDTILLSLGINDAACAIAKLTATDLQL